MHTHTPHRALQTMRARVGMRTALNATHEKPPTHKQREKDQPLATQHCAAASSNGSLEGIKHLGLSRTPYSVKRTVKRTVP